MCYLPYFHSGYQALALNYMKSIRGYYCLLGLSCPLLFIIRPPFSNLSSSNPSYLVMKPR